MTRAEILPDMMFDVPSRPTTIDMPVYLREQGRPA